MAMGVLSVQQDRKKAEACSGRVFLLYELFRYGDDSAAAGTMRLVRGIIFLLSGLLLAGCMQSGPAWDANFTGAIGRNWRAHPINRRRFHSPFSVKSFNTAGRNRQVLSWSIPMPGTSTSYCPKARRSATAR